MSDPLIRPLPTLARKSPLPGLLAAACAAGSLFLASCQDPFNPGAGPARGEDGQPSNISIALAAACNATLWKSGTQYAAGAMVRYTDGNYYIAEHANPGYNPTVSTWYWDPHSCSVSGGGTGDPGSVCEGPDWRSGTAYVTGTVVRYAPDGKFYIAEHDNPGYNPTISTWFWEPTNCAGTGTGGGTGGGSTGDSTGGGTGGTGGGTGDTGGGTGGGTTPVLTWRAAHLTWYTSYPDPGSEECIVYNGCTWAGYFAALSGQQSREWVKANNIAAVHERDFEKYRLKTLRLKQGDKQIDVKVYDKCSDSDCDGCCTRNLGTAGFLIDIEENTAYRFGTRSGTVDWSCIDCQ